MPPFSRTRRRNRKPRPPDERGVTASRSTHRPRLSSGISKKRSCQRRGLSASCRHDRLSALTDDLLLLILQRVDTRTALGTATLSKRWACLPRCLDALDFRVSDILPARYYECIRIRGEAAHFPYERPCHHREGFHALSSLVLEDLPRSTPTAAYEAIFTLCPQLQALHLKSCMLNHSVMAIHAPKSEIKQLIMEDCWFGLIELHTLPMLESLAVVQTDVSYKFSSFPYLTHLNITFRRGILKTRFFHVKNDHDLNEHLGGTPVITNLIISFTGYDRWFKPWSSTLLFPKLRRLLVADVPSSWDVSWPRLLIEAAPCLESLHIHIAPWEEEPRDDISWQPPEFCHNQLKELVIIGFQGTERQIYFVNFVIKVSMSLQLVSLYRNGYVQDKGRWDWDIVTQQYQWLNEEKVKILNQIADSAPCAATPIQVVLE
ncbi:unnamed protein product [Urochloa decumbens]|uniref:F-box domain-containing protein n=1 Tax=Urochloa decumbens TaxID=240449 RepID=A0ABC8W2C6_9POAL